MIEEELSADAQKLASHIQSLGGGFKMLKAEPANHIGAIIADAVLQVGHRWKTHVGPRVTRIREKYPQAATSPGLLKLLKTVGPEELLQWKGLDEQDRFHHTAQFFASEGVETVSDLKRWLEAEDNRERLITKSTRSDKAGIPKIADKTADYYRVMVGLQDAVAIDSLIRAFLKDAGVRGGQYYRARAIVQFAAQMLSATKNMSIHPIDLDQSIWQFQSQKEERKMVKHSRSAAFVAAEDTTKQQEYAMNENKNDQVLQVAIPAQNMKRLKRVAEDAFGVDASTLAKIWIIDRLIQLGVCYPYQPVELQDTGSEEASLSGGSLYLKGTLDNGEGRPWPLGVRINKKESGRLPWKQHVVDITLIINNNPHPATLRIYTGHSQFQSEGAYIKQDNRFKKDLVNLGLNRLDHVELEIDGAKKTITVTKKILKQTGTS